MNENKELFMAILMNGIGAFVLLASIFNWNFFFENRKARLFMKLFGRTGARIFYGLLAIVLFLLAYKINTLN